jgi:hypothetical protein
VIKNLLDQDEERVTDQRSSPPFVTSLFDDSITPDDDPSIFSSPEPQSMAETVRQSGLAYSAGIILFASVAFMLVIGWGADLLFGSSPWGVVAGIVLGSLIGFVQFFRITSQIFKK